MIREERTLESRPYVNEKSQIERVDFVETDKKNADGTLITSEFKVKPFLTGMLRISTVEKKIPVKIKPSGSILVEEADLEATNRIVEIWNEDN